MDERFTKMAFLSDGIAVVTGGGSGIGRGVAKKLSDAGCGLGLGEIDEKSLVETAGMVPGKGAAVSTHVLDVADEAGVRAFAEDVRNRHGRVTLLINNAGMALHGTFEEISLDDLRWLMGINFWGIVYGVKYFLPILKQQPRAHLVNLSSIFGIVAPAGQTAYSASKFAVRGFTEALRHELEGSSVFVSCVYPGGIRTPIAERGRLGTNAPKARKNASVSRLAHLAKTSPEDPAARILRGVEPREPRILVGFHAHPIDTIQRLHPATHSTT